DQVLLFSPLVEFEAPRGCAVYATAGEIGTRKICIHQGGGLKVRRDQLCPTEARAAEVRPDEVRSGEVRLAEVRPSQVRPAEVRPQEARVGEVRAEQVGRNE